MRVHFLLAGLAAVTLAACSTKPLPPQPPQAVVNLQPAVGSHVHGTVTFTQQANGHVRMSALVYGLNRGKEHGFHIHEGGSCASAGGHFTAVVNPHGKYDQPHHHSGDLPSLRGDSNGVGVLNVHSPNVMLTSGIKNVVGRTLSVHAMPDDYRTQPNGNSGNLVACGVIRAK